MPNDRIRPEDVSGETQTALAETKRQRQAQAKRAHPRQKQTYDLPARVIAGIKEIADSERVSQSDLAALALVRFLEAYHAGEIELDKKAARSVRFDYRVLLPRGWR